MDSSSRPNRDNRRRIAYDRLPENGPGSEIYVMNADGTDQRRLATGCCFDWSPEGRRIAFVNDGVDGVYVINVDGTGLRRLSAPEAAWLDWSPDGRSIALTYGPGGITVVKADGSTRPISQTASTLIRVGRRTGASFCSRGTAAGKSTSS